LSGCGGRRPSRTALVPTTYNVQATAAIRPTTKNPTRPGGCNSTGTTPAATHASWKRVSN
jgi:hypothetical protein